MPIVSLKKALQTIIAGGHRTFSASRLPDRVAIYFHELEPHQHERFTAAIEALRALGYRDATIEQYLDPPNGEKLFFVSFDDNYRSWHASRGVFDALQLRATFYVNTLPLRERSDETTIAAYFDRIRFSGDRQTLSEGELLALARDGHTIGCHSHSHFMLSSLAPAHWADEIDRSKHILEDLVGAAVVHFAYPFGMRRCFSPQLDAYCRSIGFRSVAAATPGMLHAPVRPDALIQRSGWRFDDNPDRNLTDLRIDGRLFERLTGRSPIG